MIGPHRTVIQELEIEDWKLEIGCGPAALFVRDPTHFFSPFTAAARSLGTVLKSCVGTDESAVIFFTIARL